MCRNLVLMLIILAAIPLFPLQAEKALMSPAGLREVATHVVTGQVKAIYQRTESDQNWQYTRYVAEIRVSASEKGDSLKPGDLVYVRYWHRNWIGKSSAPADTNGHGGLPAAKDHVRVYLARNAYDGFHDDNNDGGYNVIGTNGFAKLKAPADK